MSTSEDNPTDVPMDTADEQIIHKLAQLRADSTRLNRLTSEHDIPVEVSAQLAFMSSDIDTLAREVVEYIAGGDPLPETCPVCGDPVTQPEEGREAGKSYAAEKLCVLEESSLGVSQSIIHYESDSRSDEADHNE